MQHNVETIEYSMYCNLLFVFLLLPREDVNHEEEMKLTERLEDNEGMWHKTKKKYVTDVMNPFNIKEELNISTLSTH